MAFSTVFKNLRRNANLTQEEVAEALSVTPQAVSRWECGSAMPDIALIPKITYLFGVTADYLLEIDVSRVETEVQTILESTSDAHNRGDREEVLRILREGLRKFPNHPRLTATLASNLNMSIRRSLPDEERKARCEEVAALCEYLLANSTDTDCRYIASTTLIYLMTDPDNAAFLENGREKAKELIDTLPSRYHCREEMQMNLMTREEIFEQRKKNAFRFFYDDLPFLILYMNENPNYTLDEQIAAFEHLCGLYNAALPDDEIYTRSWHNNMFYETGAELYRRKGNTEAMLSCLRVQRDEVIRFDQNRYSEDHSAGTFTLNSPLFRGITEKKGRVQTSLSCSFSREMHNRLTGKDFAAYRGNPDFESILTDLDISAKKYE
ncbi:MAG: helix-turn-helix transcriptional regulator [Clostridia bacterium]|nr:helix-turn-helix transcriptional regulator [Clostridia bacterium]